MRKPQTKEKKFIKGTENRLIRYYFYLSSGLTVLNEFRNLFLGIFAIYIMLKLDNWIWFPIMAIPSIIILTITGYYNVHKVSKVKEYLSVKFGSHYQIKQYKLLQEIASNGKGKKQK